MEVDLEAFDTNNNRIYTFNLSKPRNYFGSGSVFSHPDYDFYRIDKKFKTSKYSFIIKIQSTHVYIRNLDADHVLEVRNRKIKCHFLVEAQIFPGDEIVIGLLIFVFKDQSKIKCCKGNNHPLSFQQQKMVTEDYQLFMCIDHVKQQESEISNNKYKLIEKIKESEINPVYKAVEILTGKVVVIKLFRGVSTNLRNELYITNQLRHNHILNFIELIQFDNSQYGIVYDYIRGGDLYSYLRRNRKITIESACQIILQLLEALIYAHGKHTIHHDIKPSNVLLIQNISKSDLPSGTQLIKLSDFGISAIMDKQTQAIKGESFKGTPLFAAPEQFTNRPRTTSIDLYSVGITFYYILTNEFPYEKPYENMQDLIARKQSEERIPIEYFLKDKIHDELARIINKSINLRIDQRYESAYEFHQNLKKFCLINVESPTVTQ